MKIIQLTYLILLFYCSFSSNAQTANNADTIVALKAFLKNEIAFYLKDSQQHTLINGTKFSTNPTIDISFIDSCDFKFDIKKSDLLLKDHVLYEVDLLNAFDCKTHQVKIGNFQRLFGFDRSILVAYSNSFKILSGPLYDYMFSHMFRFNDKQPETYLDYLKLKLYRYDLQDLAFVKKNRKWIYFSATETIFTKPYKVYFRISRDNPDIVESLGWKISGKYRDSEKIEVCG
jgi:hypothetical protein